jgi:hypothetical protein
VADDKLEISHGIAQCLKFGLKHIHMPQNREGLLKIGDFGQHGHVLLDLADDVGIEEALTEKPLPDHQELSTR